MTPKEAIARLDDSISRHPFRPRFAILATRLIKELHSTGRITFREGVLHTRAIFLDENIIITEDQTLDDFEFKLPIIPA